MSGKYEKFVRNAKNKVSLRNRTVIRACIAEACGTAILVLFGCGVLCQAFLGDHGNKKHGSFISISLGWGMAVAFGVFFAGSNGHGLINPAITIAFTLLGRVPITQAGLFILSQIFGAFIGAMALFGIYYENIWLHAEKFDGGNLYLNTTGNMFVTNPWASHTTCFFDQVAGTAFLAAGALAVVDPPGWKLPKWLHPLYLGLLVFTLVGCFALNAGCALNPARDLGPRLMLLCFGWGSQAFSGGNYFFWIPILGPIIGAIIGGVLYELTIGAHLDQDKSDDEYESSTTTANQGDPRELGQML